MKKSSPASPQTALEGSLRQKLINRIHSPVAWAKVGKHGDVYSMDVEKTDRLAEDMADYALALLAETVGAVIEQCKVDDMFIEWNGLNLVDADELWQRFGEVLGKEDGTL